MWQCCNKAPWQRPLENLLSSRTKRHTGEQHQFSLFSQLNPQKQPPLLYQTRVCLKSELNPPPRQSACGLPLWMVLGTVKYLPTKHFLLSRENSAVVSCRLSNDTWIKCYLRLWMQLLQRGAHFDPASHGRQIYSFCLWLHVGDNKKRDQMTLFPPIKTFYLIPGKYIWINLI